MSFLTTCGFWPQWVEFLLFACMLLGVCIVFSIMAHFYTYVDPDQVGQLSEDDDEDAKKTPADLVLKETSTQL